MTLRILSVIFLFNILFNFDAHLVLPLVLLLVVIHSLCRSPMVQSLRTQFITIYTEFRMLIAGLILGIGLLTMTTALPAEAVPDPYIAQYLKVQPDEVAVMADRKSVV